MNELLTVRDVAEILKISPDSVVRRFAKTDGVINLGTSGVGRRRYRVLRIPKQVVERYLAKKSGQSVQVEIPQRAERRRKSADWETRAILNLAKAGLQNDSDEKTYQRIANRARLLTHVPENRWSDITWFDNED